MWLSLPLLAANAAAELPDGGAFRAQMLAWTTTESAAPHRAERAPTAIPLPALSSRFGQRTDPIDGHHAHHFGIDIPGAQGTTIAASAPGVVRFAGGAGSYGEMVEIDHGDGLRTRYAHLSAVLVRPGEAVSEGEPIARMGATGRATGSHLHFEVRRDGQPLDPLAFLGRARASTTARATPMPPETRWLSDFARARLAAAPARDLGR